MTRNIISVACMNKCENAFYLRMIVLFIKEMIIMKSLNSLHVLDLNSPMYHVDSKQLKSCDLNKAHHWHRHLRYAYENAYANFKSMNT